MSGCFKSNVVRRYEVLPSKNHFYCCGRCIGSSQISIFLFTVALIVAVTLAFFIFDCPYLYVNVSPAIPFIAALLFSFVICVLFRTACTDPGILPRSEKDEVLYNERQAMLAVNSNHPDGPSQMQNNLQMPRYKEIQVRGRTVKLKYCFTCKLYRPPRSSHCSICDNCVDKFDHHCPYVANCVGKRNYRFFYLFLVSLSLLTLFILGCNVANIVLRTRTKIFVEVIKDTPATVVEAVICFFSMWSIICLAGYHTYLIACEVSTNEDIKDSFSIKRHHLNNNSLNNNPNPYDRGNCCLNFAHVLCSSLPPSNIRLRETIPIKLINNLTQSATNNINNNYNNNNNNLHNSFSTKDNNNADNMNNNNNNNQTFTTINNHQPQSATATATRYIQNNKNVVVQTV